MSEGFKVTNGVRQGGILSPYLFCIYMDELKVTNGVSQGGILSPYLFCIYMDELSERLNRVATGCILGEVQINHLMYADDIVLASPTALGLCKLLEVCDKFGTDHDVKFNSTKSSVLVFRYKLLKNNVYSRSFLKNEEIPFQDNYKYLGHIICDDLEDEQDISRQCKKVYAQGNTLIRKFGMCTENVKRFSLVLSRQYQPSVSASISQ